MNKKLDLKILKKKKLNKKIFNVIEIQIQLVEIKQKMNK